MSLTAIKRRLFMKTQRTFLGVLNLLAVLLTIQFGGATALAQTFNVIEDFSTAGAGSGPQGDLILSGGVLYGSTKYGGAGSGFNQPGYGTIYEVNTNGTGYMVLKSFQTTNTDGYYPEAGLTLASGVLYGTTAAGGSSGRGTVFKMNADGTGYGVLKHFLVTDGYAPFGGVALSGATLFGTTVGGGSGNNGTIFKVNTNGTGFAVLTNFPAYPGSPPYTNNFGDAPYTGLTLSGSVLYGTAKFGGTGGNGVVFKIEHGRFRLHRAEALSRYGLQRQRLYQQRRRKSGGESDGVRQRALWDNVCRGQRRLWHGVQGQHRWHGLYHAV